MQNRSRPHGLLSSFRTRVDLHLEVAALRHQVEVLGHDRRTRLRLTRLDRTFWLLLYRIWSHCLDTAIVKPETVVRWNREGIRASWFRKSRLRRRGRPPVPADIKNLIRRIRQINILYGAPRIHGELLKLGIGVGQTSVAKYMTRRRWPRSRGWKTFLRNHADGVAGTDLFGVPTISFRLAC
jgi:hypothetical protein